MRKTTQTSYCGSEGNNVLSEGNMLTIKKCLWVEENKYSLLHQGHKTWVGPGSSMNPERWEITLKTHLKTMFVDFCDNWILKSSWSLESPNHSKIRSAYLNASREHVDSLSGAQEEGEDLQTNPGAHWGASIFWLHLRLQIKQSGVAQGFPSQVLK